MKLTKPLKRHGVDWVCTWEATGSRCEHRATRKLANFDVLKAAQLALPGISLRPPLCDEHVNRVRQLVGS